nr:MULTISPECIES: response regulator transcription factor [Pseudofrankia]
MASTPAMSSAPGHAAEVAGAAARRSSGLVLVVEDEPHICDLIRLYLTREGFGVEVRHDGAAGLAAARVLAPVAIVLDIRLPGLDGRDVVRALRADDDWTPVLFVTARDDEVDRILGLELGADDYLVKPFSPRELVARLRAVLRRAGPQADRPASRVLRAGAVELDLDRRLVRAGGAAVALTATEFDLLAALLTRPGLVFTRERLLSQVWGYQAAAGTRTVDVHVAQVRAKLGAASPIRTVRGVGYTADG